MRFSVLIATRNRPSDLVPCLKTVLALDCDDYEVVVVDQSDSGDAESAVREAIGAPERLHYVRSSSVGKSHALNLLMEQATGEILAFTDDDTVVPPDWLKRIEKAFADNPEADVLFGQVLPDRDGPKTGGHVPSFVFSDRRFLASGEVSGMGANMAMRRHVAGRQIQFDPFLGPGAPMPASEEGDFIYRMHAQGIRVLHEPEVTLVHRAVRAPDQWLRVLYSYGLGDAAFAMKHLRCGDLGMAPKMVVRYGHFAGRLCWRILCRRRHQEEHYLRGYRAGIAASLRYRVDRRTRLYTGTKHAARGTV